MRKLLPLLLVCCCLVGCSGLNQSPEEQTELRVDQKEYVVSASGAIEYGADMFIYASKKCSISGETEWCSASLGLSNNWELTKYRLDLRVGQNTTYEERRVTLTVQCGELSEQIQITQRQNNAIIVGEAKYEVALEGETIEVEVQANVSVRVRSYEPWVTPVAEVAGKGLTTTKYQFKAAKNDTPSNRNTQIEFFGYSSDGKLVSEYVTITQSGVETLITNAQSPYELDAKGGDFAFDIETNLPSFTAESSVIWIQKKHNSGGKGQEFTIKANESPVARTGTITIKAGAKTAVVTINQKGLFKKLVKQIVSTDNNGAQTIDFTYDNQGRLTQKGTTTYEYKTDGIHEYGQEKHKYSVQDGRVFSVVLNFLSASAQTLYYSYNYLTNQLSAVDPNYGGGYNSDKTYTWSGDNMVKMTKKAGATYSFTYSISPNYINYDFSEVMNPTLGFSGLPSRNLIENYTVGNKTYSYAYQLDSDGCPTTVTEVVTESGASLQTTTYTITY